MSDKVAARAQARRVRAQAYAADPDAGARLATILLATQADWHGTVVAGYAAIRTELPLWPALAVLAAAGAQLALPVVIGEAQPLQFRAWEPGRPLSAGGLNIPAPPAEAPLLRPTHILLPLLAFDAQGYRLGYGGGYYDRTLASLRAEPAGALVSAIGVAYDEQQCGAVPRDGFDQPLDALATPTRFWRFQ